MKQLLLLWALLGLTAATSAIAVTIAFVDQHHQNDALRSIMCYAEHAVRTRPGIPAKQRHEAIVFYDRALAEARLRPCDNG